MKVKKGVIITVLYCLVLVPRCVWFILEPLVSKSENCSFLRKLIEAIKQMKDAQKPEDRGINRV